VRGIIREQFGSEVNYKEGELEMIEDRIHLAKMMLQRLRLGVLAQHYGVAAFYPTALDYREETIGEQHNWEVFEEYLSQQESGAESAPAGDAKDCDTSVKEATSAADKEAASKESEGVVTCNQETAKQQNHVLQAAASVTMETSPPPPPPFSSSLPWKKDPPLTLKDPPFVSQKSSPLTPRRDSLLSSLEDPPLAPLRKPSLTSEDPPLAPLRKPSLTSEVEDSSPRDPPQKECSSIPQGGSFPPPPPRNSSLSAPRPPPPLSTPRATTVVPQSGDDDGMSGSRFYFKKRVIVGNTSQYLDPTAKGDGSTHKWMVYVRGAQEEPDISHFVRAVRFFLHPSYHPNDIVHVRSPPFHLTRLGWGEFPVRVQLEFCDKFNKSVDIIHNLVLDRTHTGQQTLGAETVVDLDIVTPPPGGEKTFRMNGVSISSTTISQRDDRSTTSSSCDMQPSLPPLSPPALPPLSPPALMEPEQDDGNAPPTPGSWSGQTTPHSSVGVTSVLTTNLDKCLHNAVRNIPIYGKANPAEDFFIPAPSLSQYRLWHIGRRRATEWLRAVAIKNSISRRLKLPALLSTKQVMQWCRQNGYTPLDPVPAGGRGFCKVCGCQLEAGLEEEEDDWVDDMDNEGSEGMGVVRKCPEVHEHCQVMMFGRHGLPLRGSAMDPFQELQPNSLMEEEGVASLPKLCSLSQPHDLVARILSQHGRLEDCASKHDEDVDVCSMPASPSCARSRALVDMVPRFRVPQTPELKWVQQTAASIGIHIYPAVIDRMYAHVVEHMIYISCTRFLRGVLAQAVQGSGKMLEGKLSQDRVLTPFHVQQAILKLEHCDFLTNQYLGLRPSGEADKNMPSNTASESSSSSSSSAGSSDEGEGGGAYH
jgi:hypothetical protein